MLKLRLPHSSRLASAVLTSAGAAVSENARVEVGDGNADVGGRGGELALGGADVGPAAEQVGGQAGGDGWRGRNCGVARQAGPSALRASSPSSTPSAWISAFAWASSAGIAAAAAARSDAAARQVLPVDQAAADSRRDQPLEPLLPRELGLGVGDPLLQRAQAEIGDATSAATLDLHIAPVPDRRAGAGPRRLDRAAGPAEQVDLPAASKPTRKVLNSLPGRPNAPPPHRCPRRAGRG